LGTNQRLRCDFGATQDLIKALQLATGERGKAIGDLMTIVAKSKIDNTNLATIVGHAPDGLFNKWPLSKFLDDSARMADVPGFARLITATPRGKYQPRWGGCHELLVSGRPF